MSNALLLTVSILCLSVCILCAGDSLRDRDWPGFALALFGSALNGLAIGLRVGLMT